MSRRLPAGCSAHALRHRFASRAYASAFDIRSVQVLLGHSSPAVTARYVAVPSTQLVNAVLAVPPIPGIGPPSSPRRCHPNRVPKSKAPRPDAVGHGDDSRRITGSQALPDPGR